LIKVPGALDLWFDQSQAGIRPVLGNGQVILVAQQLTVLEDKRETLKLGLREAGANVLGSHWNEKEGGQRGQTDARSQGQAA
jgi:hypothetical protein